MSASAAMIMSKSHLETASGTYSDLDQYWKPRPWDSGKEGDGIVGASRAISCVMEQIRTVAPTDSTVLIEGETGRVKK